jgi:hypothetical protein
VPITLPTTIDEADPREADHELGVIAEAVLPSYQHGGRLSPLAVR